MSKPPIRMTPAPLQTASMSYWVYIITNKTNSTLYIGVTNNLLRRINEHKNGEIRGFTAKYRLKKLIYAEETDDVMNAIEREKQIKRWRRYKKVQLIEKVNPKWEEIDLV